ncbi:histone deacetylase complex subunit SAP30 Sin3-binding domain-containing protein [Aspergillus fischeri NRRL 181]|uniref:Histone deacetylase complex subunit SAP30 Sin3 binding domain-containing protein n=1 Tax=Neosartorya fischeri (strain ATCC 1020 / DSM 3700 / CBS 544.65 / FGSC A1164 / JCM 1740 / NRRL 181 / WB 181) TaxID=331117 RepID=A1DH88_NEOFI|nr:conserved hypothetical protein [Aspergillus fischeri NRRL 181]EAW18745.1 conserved hypothetical protein [Aspergillus fischeri NRRL 181]
MAPPRQRTAGVQDDSRSEASNGTREQKSTTAKGRKVAGASLALSSTSSREVKVSTAVANVTSAPANPGDQPDDLPKIQWSEMSLDFLHSYRHAYKLSCPSAFSSDYSRILLSQGIGLRSPTSIAAQRAKLQQQNEANGTNGITGRSHHRKHHGLGPPEVKAALNRTIGQGRVSKTQLATAVRKHFNSAALAEQEAIARFLYKVREKGRGRQFRLRFQP